MRWIVAAMALALSSSVAAQEQQQFNLVCRGLEQLTPGGRQRQAVRVYRIDLERKVWCISECSIVKAFVEITDARLTMQRLERSGLTLDHYVDRISGEARDVDFEGQCRPAPFSPIPNRRF